MLLMFAFVLYCFNISTLFVWLLIIYTLFFSVSSAAKEKPQIAEVIEVGPGEKVDGKLEEMNVKKGDSIIVSKYSGTEVKYEGEEYLIVKQDDILAIVE